MPWSATRSTASSPSRPTNTLIDAFAARELERVGDEVADDLLEPHRVAADPHGLGHEVDAALVAGVAGGDGSDDALTALREIHRRRASARSCR